MAAAFLGLTFNWGMVMAYCAVLDQLSLEIILLYISAIFWTLGYDTIYGAQDIVDDEIIGIKSTAIKFKKNIKFFVGVCYLVTILLISYVFERYIEINFTVIFLIMFFFTLIYQLIIFNRNKPRDCLKAFKTNNLAGAFIFIFIFFLDYGIWTI